MQKTFTVTDEAGLHARPASLLCNASGKFPGDVYIIYQGKRYTLKSIMVVMSLGIPQGGEFTLEVDGEDEEIMIGTLTSILVDHKLV
ncbi:MAG: HPr family phosphocarrier protein [Bacilli bacterium]|nr:HPr family phosphocarrier protein [Bacilli bacterium]